MQGKIIKIISNLYTIQTEEGLIECHARGKFRNEKITPLVGDYCIIDKENQYILELLPRKNYLERPMIANVDVALIVTSVKKPNLSFQLLDKMLSIVTLNKIEPVLCFSKLDLLSKQEKKEFKKIVTSYQKIGYQVVTNQKLTKLKKILKNKIVVITGQTGAGKSTLLNKLDKKIKLENR